MKLPQYHETFLPILEILEKIESMNSMELCRSVRDKYYSNLPQDLLNQETNTGANTLLDRIFWGKSYLKMGKFVDSPKRGMVKITEKGKLALKNEKLSLNDLRNDDDFLIYDKNKKSKKENKLFDIKNEDSVENLSPQDLIDKGFNTIETQIKVDLLEKLKNVDPYYFEKILLILLREMGYGDFTETAKSGDGGIDGIINEDKLGLEKIYIQAKRYKENKVHEIEIRNFIGAMSGDTTKGIFVTTSTFDDKAIKKAKEAHHKIILIDGKKLVDLMYKYKVGLQVNNTYEIKKIDDDFFEEN